MPLRVFHIELNNVARCIKLYKRGPNFLWCKIKFNETERARFFSSSTNLQTTKYFISTPTQQQCSASPTDCTRISWSFVRANGRNSSLLKRLVVRATGFTGSDVSKERTTFSLKRQMYPTTWRHILNSTGAKVTSCVKDSGQYDGRRKSDNRKPDGTFLRN